MKKQEKPLIVIANSYFLCENNTGLCVIAQADSLLYKFLGNLVVRQTCYGVLWFIRESRVGPKAARSWCLGNPVKIVDGTVLTIC